MMSHDIPPLLQTAEKPFMTGRSPNNTSGAKSFHHSNRNVIKAELSQNIQKSYQNLNDLMQAAGSRSPRSPRSPNDSSDLDRVN